MFRCAVQQAANGHTALLRCDWWLTSCCTIAGALAYAMQASIPMRRPAGQAQKAPVKSPVKQVFRRLGDTATVIKVGDSLPSSALAFAELKH